MDVAKFEEYLISSNALTKTDRTKARTLGTTESISSVEAMIDLGLLSCEQMGQYLAAFTQIPYVPIQAVPPPQESRDTFSAKCAAYWKIYPYAYDPQQDQLTIAVYTPMQIENLVKHQAFFMLPHQLVFTIAAKPEIEEAISTHMGIEVRRKPSAAQVQATEEKAAQPEGEKLKFTSVKEKIEKRKEMAEKGEAPPVATRSDPMASVRMKRRKRAADQEPAPTAPAAPPPPVAYDRMSAALRSMAVQIALSQLEGDHTQLSQVRALVRYCQLLATRMNLSPLQSDGLVLAAWLSALEDSPDRLMQIQLPYDIGMMLDGTGGSSQEAIIFSLIKCYQEMKETDPQMATDVNLTRRNLRNRWAHASDHQEMLETFLQVLMDEAFLKELSQTVGKILVVDPNEISTSSLTPPLQSDGYEVMVIPGSEDLTDVAKDFQPDLVMVDTQLPKGDCLKLFRDMKKHEDTSGLKIMALVSEGGEKRASECLRAGADDYMIRPPNLELMFLKIQRLLELPEGGAEEAGVTGSLADMSFTDMIQVLSAGGKSTEIVLTDGDREGHVVVQGGDIIHAQEGDMVGEKAFYSMMRWTDGEFVTRQCTEFPERTVQGTTMGLLMEGARQVDEGGEVSEGYQSVT